MKLFVVFLAFSFPVAHAWKISSRCLGEGELLAGDEVDNFFDDEDQYFGDGFDLDEESFDWDTFAAFDVDTGETMGLRGSDPNSRIQNSTFLYSNSTRELQSGRTFNLKLYWRSGYCWQDEWTERKWCMQCRGVRARSKVIVLSCAFNNVWALTFVQRNLDKHKMWLTFQSCSSGEGLQIQKCSNKATQRFQWSNGRIKVASKNNCLSRSGGLRLRPCGGSGQGFSGYRSSGGFQLRPSGGGGCLTQEHHPKVRHKTLQLCNFCNVSHNITNPYKTCVHLYPRPERSLSFKAVGWQQVTRRTSGTCTGQVVVAEVVVLTMMTMITTIMTTTIITTTITTMTMTMTGAVPELWKSEAMNAVLQIPVESGKFSAQEVVPGCGKWH